jgi:predicted tellurium resistance membrane protein TerC
VELLTQPENWIALITLVVMELVLGIDNIVFISIMSDKAQPHLRVRAQQVGLSLAVITRSLLLLALSWVIRLTAPLFTLLGHTFSGRDLILVGGGLFLIYKATQEIHGQLAGESEGHPKRRAGGTFPAIVAQIVALDIVFSLDSVITAVGMADELIIMIAAVIIAIGIMLLAARPVAQFVNERPTIKMLALAFLLLIGVSLLADGFGVHIPKDYIYAAMAFSVFVEMLNLWARQRARARRAAGRPAA